MNQILIIINVFFLLIQKYKELLGNKDVFIESEIYVKILDTIGEIIECLKSIKEIDINRLEQLIDFYNGILEKYYTIYPKDINAELDNLNNSFKDLSVKEPISLSWENNNNSRTRAEAVELSNYIDLLIKYINDIIEIVDKYYKLNQYEVIQEDSRRISAHPATKAELVTSNDKPSFFSRLIYRIKSFLGLNGVDIVGDSPYIEINSEKEFREKYLLKNSEIKLQHIPNEEYIIADKTNTEPNRFKNTDTIICSDDSQYFRIVSDNTTIVYEEYKAESYLDNCGLFIRSPLNSKVGREYIKYKERDNGFITEYSIEEERNGMCSIIIQNKNSRERLYMQYESKNDTILGKEPKRIVIENALVKLEFEKDNRNKYEGKYYKYLLGKSEWDEPINLDEKYKFIETFEKFGYIIRDVDPSIINIDIVREGIKATIPDKILQIYSKVHPEIATMILDYGKEQEEKIETERN